MADAAGVCLNRDTITLNGQIGIQLISGEARRYVMWLLSSLGYTFLACVLGVGGNTQISAQEVPSNSCPLFAFTEAQVVSVRARVAYGPHDLLITLEGCDDAIVLEYLSSSSEQKTPQDKSLKEFRDYVDSRYRKVGKGICLQCPKYDVIAMFTGRLQIASTTVPKGLWKDGLGWLHDDSGRFVAPAGGFGHPPVYKYSLTLASVADIRARKLPKPKLQEPEPSRPRGVEGFSQ